MRFKGGRGAGLHPLADSSLEHAMYPQEASQQSKSLTFYAFSPGSARAFRDYEI